MLKNLNKRNRILVIIAIILFVIAIPLTIAQVQKQQDLRQRAEEITGNEQAEVYFASSGNCDNRLAERKDIFPNEAVPLSLCLRNKTAGTSGFTITISSGANATFQSPQSTNDADKFGADTTPQITNQEKTLFFTRIRTDENVTGQTLRLLDFLLLTNGKNAIGEDIVIARAEVVTLDPDDEDGDLTVAKYPLHYATTASTTTSTTNTTKIGDPCDNLSNKCSAGQKCQIATCDEGFDASFCTGTCVIDDVTSPTNTPTPSSVTTGRTIKGSVSIGNYTCPAGMSCPNIGSLQCSASLNLENMNDQSKSYTFSLTNVQGNRISANPFEIKDVEYKYSFGGLTNGNYNLSLSLSDCNGEIKASGNLTVPLDSRDVNQIVERNFMLSSIASTRSTATPTLTPRTAIAPTATPTPGSQIVATNTPSPAQPSSGQYADCFVYTYSDTACQDRNGGYPTGCKLNNSASSKVNSCEQRSSANYNSQMVSSCAPCSIAPQTPNTPNIPNAPTATPTPAAPAPGDTVLAFSSPNSLEGLFTHKGSLISHKDQELTVYLYKSTANPADDLKGEIPAYKKTITLSFKDNKFSAPSLNLGKVAPDTYKILIKSPKYLRKLVATQTISASGGTITIPSNIKLASGIGDINNDNVLNIHDYNIIAACLDTNQKMSDANSRFKSDRCQNLKKQNVSIENADFNDDDRIDAYEINIFIESLSFAQRSGD